MSTPEVLNMLDQAADFGIAVYNAWTAEPLMREDLPVILGRAKSRGLVTCLVTNGLLLGRRVRDIRDLDMLTVSLDGIRSYKELRGIDPAPVLQGIREAREAGHEILINCVISGKNIAELEDMVHLAESLGCWISFEPMHSSPEISREVWQSLAVQDLPAFDAAMDRLMELKQGGAPLINSLTYLKMIKATQNHSQSRKAGRKFACHAPDIIMHVAADGTIGACRVHQEPLGNISSGLANVWEETRERRRELAEKCGGCMFFGYVENSLLYDFVPEVMRHYQWK
jgi:MoaA/NifB/PqqE/SkfB family radical SAM enzyme